MVLRNPALGGTSTTTPEGLKLNPHLKWGVANLKDTLKELEEDKG